MLQLALEAFAAFFVTVAPLNAAPLFAALTAGVDPAQRRLMAVKGVVIAAVALLAFGILGDDLLRVLGITLPAVRVGGGILLTALAAEFVLEGLRGSGIVR
jgi:multiple antibiotic resistance protein